MALSAKLQDVEQQLTRATQIVQLHVKITDDLLSSKGPVELDAPVGSPILGLIDSVERAQRGLQMVTTQLLDLAKRGVPTRPTEEEVKNNYVLY